jgi:hypothetical protein
MTISQSTQFLIKTLSITSFDGNTKYDIKGLFEELNIHDSLMTPVMSGSVLIRDAIGLSNKIKFDGSEYIDIDIVKDSEQNNNLVFKKRFIIYKQSDRKQINQSSEMYILNFVSEEFILSKQKKIQRLYKGEYSTIVSKILKDELGVNLMSIEKTKGIKEIVIPNLSPFESIEYVTKRSVSMRGLPDFLFWQNQLQYNFMSLSEIVKQPTVTEIDFGTKNLAGETSVDEISGARDVKVLSQFNLAENIAGGVYAGKFMGFDTLTRTVATTNISKDDVYKLTGKHANSGTVNSKIPNKEKKSADGMYDSNMTVYPFQYARTKDEWLKKMDTKTANIIDDTHSYILQRKAVFYNFLQKRLRITMPGNFALMSGFTVNVNMPNRSKDSNINGDQSLSGKYVITGVRHVIRFDKHETILEVSTDSTNQK